LGFTLVSHSNVVYSLLISKKVEYKIMLTSVVIERNLDTPMNYMNTEEVNMTQHEAPSWKGREPVRVRFGRRLHELRTSKGYTQMQLAMNAGLDRSFISDIERGVKEPTISTLDMLAVVFIMTLSEMFEGV
jgi:DNA-binding XRE family transcriptional regulator